MRILFLSRWFPYPADNGSKLRIYNLLRGLQQYHDITLLSFVDQSNVNVEAPEILSICSDVHVVSWKEFNPQSMQARLGFLNLTPRSLIDTFSTEMAQYIIKELSKEKYDLVIASQIQMAAYFPYFQKKHALFEELEIGLYYDRVFSGGRKKRLRQALTWYKLRIYLSRLLDFFEACTVVSDAERQLLTQNFPGFKKQIEVIPNCLHIEEYKPILTERKRNTLIFTGSFRYHTNYEAMLWFVRDVFPLIIEQIPDAQLIITGDHANLPLPSTRNITLAGHVEDIKPLVASSSISIAPLWRGGGTRLKILEAMAIGTPVVATSKGAEGLDVANNEHLLLADSPGEFATSVVTLLKSDGFHKQLANNARLLVENKYNWDAMLPNYLRLIDTIACCNY